VDSNIAAVWIVTVTYRARNLCSEENVHASFYFVMEGKVIVTSSELVVKLNETKFECMISSNVHVIGL